MFVVQKSVKWNFSCKFLKLTSLREDFLIFYVINCHLGGHLVRILFLVFIWLQAKCLQFDTNFIAYNLRKKMGSRHIFRITIFSLIIGFHLGRHLGYIEMLNDARVASLGFFKDNICTTRINKEKKFKIKFQVLLKFAQILLDYLVQQMLHQIKAQQFYTTFLLF